MRNKKNPFGNLKPASIDGEALARAARSKAKFSDLVWWYRGWGFTEREIIAAFTSAKTVITPLRFRGGA